MSEGIDLLAPIPLGDGPKRAHIKLRLGLANIARRVAMRALMERREDVLLEVYCAGIAHAVDLMERPHDRDHATTDDGGASVQPSASLATAEAFADLAAEFAKPQFMTTTTGPGSTPGTRRYSLEFTFVGRDGEEAVAARQRRDDLHDAIRKAAKAVNS